MLTIYSLYIYIYIMLAIVNDTRDHKSTSIDDYQHRKMQLEHN